VDREYWERRCKEVGPWRTVMHISMSEAEAKRATQEQVGWVLPYLAGGGRVVELGCGIGRFAPHIARVCTSYLGIDWSVSLLSFAERFALPGISFKQGDIAQVKVDADTVFTFTVLQHLPDDRVRKVAERIKDSPATRVVFFENTEVLPNKPHIWFRPPEFYAALFSDSFTLTTRKDFLVKGERHSLFVFDRGTTTTVHTGILSYYGLEDTLLALGALARNATGSPIFWWDNSDWSLKTEFQEGILKDFGFTTVLTRSGFNAGCSVPRNHFYWWARRQNAELLLIVDQDVCIQPGAIEEMKDALQSNKRLAGVAPKDVCVYGAKQSKRGYLPEIPGACCLWRMEALWDLEQHFGFPFDPDFLHFRWDSLTCSRLLSRGWRVRAVRARAKHFNRSAAVKRTPNFAEIRRVSERLYLEKVKRECLVDTTRLRKDETLLKLLDEQ